MKVVRDFAALRRHVEARAPISLAVAGTATAPVLESLVEEARQGLLARVVVPGPEKAVAAAIDAAGGDDRVFEIRACGSAPEETAACAAAAVREGAATVLMKGHIDSSILIRRLLDKETGLKAGELLSNVTVFDDPRYHKLVAVTDNGIVPAPTAAQKVQIAANTLPLFAALGIVPAKIALVAASEKIAPALPATVDAAEVKTVVEGERRFAGRLRVDGPFGYDVAMSREAARAKGITESDVAGDPDLLLFHDIEAANAVGKAIKFHGAAQSGGLLLGCRVPVLFNSRSDGAERRRNSLLLAAALAGTE